MDFTDSLLEASGNVEQIDVDLDGAAEGWGVFVYADKHLMLHEIATCICMGMRCTVQRGFRLAMDIQSRGYALAALTGRDEAEHLAESLARFNLKIEVVPF